MPATLPPFFRQSAIVFVQPGHELDLAPFDDLGRGISG